MVIRNIIHIDENKCNGCGQCVNACHEGAIALIDGKARLVSETYCDGLGACIGDCPVDAITMIEKEAPEFDEAAAMIHVSKTKAAEAMPKTLACGCPGTMAKSIERKSDCCTGTAKLEAESELRNWPVQLKLVPTGAPYLKGADLLLVADCVPFAYADFHGKILKEGKPIVIGCPKLDDAEFYIDKLSTLLTEADIKSLSVINMEVPCCKGITRIAQAALEAARTNIPLTETTISIDGKIISSKEL